MKYVVSLMFDKEPEVKNETYPTLKEAMHRFNVARMNPSVVEWVAISIGAWGFLIEWDNYHGIEMFRDCDEDVVMHALEYINENA